LSDDEMKAVFKKHISGLAPKSVAAEDMLKKIRLGDLVTVDIQRPRNIAHHAKFFAMLQLIHENQDHYTSVEDILTAFKFAIGHTRKIKVRAGIVEIPKSISFASMDQAAFDEFYTRALDFVVSDVIPGLMREDLERELMKFAA